MTRRSHAICGELTHVLWAETIHWLPSTMGAAQSLQARKQECLCGWSEKKPRRGRSDSPKSPKQKVARCKAGVHITRAAGVGHQSEFLQQCHPLKSEMIQPVLLAGCCARHCNSWAMRERCRDATRIHTEDCIIPFKKGVKPPTVLLFLEYLLLDGKIVCSMASISTCRRLPFSR